MDVYFEIQLQFLEERLAESQKNERFLVIRLNKCKDEKDECLEEINRLIDKETKHKVLIKTLRDDVSSLYNEISKRDRYISRLKNNLESQKEIQRYYDYIYNEQIRELQEDKTIIMFELKQNKSWIMGQTEYTQNLEKKLWEHKGIRTELENEIKRCNHDLEKCNKMLKGRCNQLNALQLELQRVNQKLESEKKSHRSQTVEDTRKLKSNSFENDDNTILQQQRLNKLENEIREQNVKVNTLNRSLEEKTFETEKLKKNINEKADQIYRLTVELQQARKMLEQTDEERKHPSYVLGTHTGLAETKMGNLDSHGLGETSEMPINTKVHLLQRELKGVKEELTRLRQQKECLEKDNDNKLNMKEKDIQHLSKQLNDTSEKLNAAISERDIERRLRQDLNRKKLECQRESNYTSNEQISQQAQKLCSDIRSRDAKIKLLEEMLSNFEKEALVNENTVTDLQKEIKKLQQVEAAHRILLSERDAALHAKHRLESHLKAQEVELNKTKDELMGKDKIIMTQTRQIQMFKSQQMQVKDSKQKIEELNDKECQLENALRKLKEAEDETEELKIRLSKTMGDKLTDNNPNITDLSDTNRPVKLAERYSELYDNQWTDALEVLEKYFDDEQSAIQLIIEILKDTSQFCKAYADQQMGDLCHILGFYKSSGRDIPVAIRKTIKDLRKATSHFVMKNMFERYISQLQRSADSRLQKGLEVKPFVRECLELCWLMTVQDPPVVFAAVAESGSRLDTNIYRPYTTTGTMVEYTVWPALLLHEDGPLLAKGVAQGCGARPSSGKTRRN